MRKLQCGQVKLITAPFPFALVLYALNERLQRGQIMRSRWSWMRIGAPGIVIPISFHSFQAYLPASILIDNGGDFQALKALVQFLVIPHCREYDWR
jgi:hypothetical protein